MPFTLLHALVVLPLHFKAPNKFEVFSIVISSMFMDLEMFPFGLDGRMFGHGIFHSYLMVLTLYPLIISITIYILFKTLRSMVTKVYVLFGFNPKSLDLKFTQIFFSCLVGGVSHIFLDMFTHQGSSYLLYPFVIVNPFYINSFVDIGVYLLTIVLSVYSLRLWNSNRHQTMI